MKVISIPCLSDNYAYLLICKTTNQAGIVDTPEFSPIWNVVQQEKVDLVAILNTHHHYDHVGGNQQLLQKLPHLKVYGHHSDRGRIPEQNIFLEESDTVSIGHLTGSITHNPGHTTGAISYYFEDAVFTGDTLFSAGCGRLFEGTPNQMYHSLHQKIADHTGEAKIYFGHEYTEANLRFAQSVEPNNPFLAKRLDEVRTLRRQGKFTTPTTLEIEQQTNPFLRCDSSEIKVAVQSQDPHNDLSPTSVFKAIRRMKDSF